MSDSLASAPHPLLAQILSLSRGVSVLYVEDEAAIREEIGEILSSLFEDVVTAVNGRQGLELFRQREFLLVVTDINMPEVNGIEMISEIRSLKPHQSILVTSAYSDANSLIPLLNLGIGSFVLKPLNWEQLLTAIYRELSLALSTAQERRYQIRLETEVKYRTEELQQTQQQILQLSSAKDTMLALISHEMRTPLNAILGFLELVKPALEGNAEALTYLQFIEEASRRLDRSTQKGLEFAQFSTSKKTFHRQDFDLHETLKRGWNSAVQNVGIEPRTGFTWKGEPGKTLSSDPEMVGEIVRNLFENNLKYGGTDPKVEVALKTTVFWTELTFSDRGPGFSDTALETLFRPFASGNVMHHSEGIGLGLALVDVIMLTLGGKVAAGNGPDGGAWVTLSFPSDPAVRTRK